jgi:hypothetical protein
MPGVVLDAAFFRASVIVTCAWKSLIVVPGRLVGTA